MSSIRTAHDLQRTREVPIAWAALEDAFENNAPEVHSYLHVGTGEVIRIVDGIADPQMHGRVMSDANYLRIEAVPSREQYRWMERFIETVEDETLAHRLQVAIDGKGAFRRFKDALMNQPEDRERWFSFRSQRLRSCMQAWLEAHGLVAVDQPEPRPTATKTAQSPITAEGSVARLPRQKLHALVDSLPDAQLKAAISYLEFLGGPAAPRDAPDDAKSDTD